MRTSIPSPTQAVWWLGDIPVRAYALCILAGIVVAVIVADRRLRARGGAPGVTMDIAAWAVPFGIVGGRIYHVITTPQPYFGDGGHPLDAFKIWNGGLGIWGAVALGALGAWIGCRRHGVTFLDFADAAAPGVLIAQAMGRFGNYFNNELYGHHTDVPWGLTIHCWDQSAGHAVTCPGTGSTVLGTFQPTFLYESIWCLLVAALLLMLDRRVSLARGQAFALYVLLYPVGRVFIEMMRTDEANHILGLRLNIWTSIIVFLGGVAGFVLAGRRGDRPGQRPDGTAEPEGAAEPEDAAADGAGDARAASRHTE